MKLDEYVKLAMRTDTKDLQAVRERMQNSNLQQVRATLRSLDLQLRMLDGQRKHLFYGRGIKDVRFNSNYDHIVDALPQLSDKNIRILHAVLGILTEGQEILEGFFKGLATEEGPDEVNLAEELADVSWYQALLVDALGISWEEQLEKNIAKLETRYGVQK